MMDADLVPELRWHQKHGSDCLHGPVCKRAADEIERLQAALKVALDTRMKYLCDNPNCPGCPSWHGKLNEARRLVTQQEPKS